MKFRSFDSLLVNGMTFGFIILFFEILFFCYFTRKETKNMLMELLNAFFFIINGL